MLQDCVSGTDAFERVDICHGNSKLTSHSFSHGTMAEMGAAEVPPLSNATSKVTPLAAAVAAAAGGLTGFQQQRVLELPCRH